ncbi:MAG: hypothetical protein QXJ28_02850 [Candidatus Pacearchaeota archaeon]
MTTAIGIKTNLGIERIVIAADNQLTISSGQFEFEKWPRKKIYTGDFWAMAFAGVYSKEVSRFFGKLKGYKNYYSSPEKSKEIIESALSRNPRRMIEVDTLNAEILSKGGSIQDTLSFIFAVNNPKLMLFVIDEYGNLKDIPEQEDFDYVCIGSGSDLAKKYIKECISSGSLDVEKITIREAILVSLGALRNARNDIYTGSEIDWVVLSKEGIYDCGESIRRNIDETYKKLVEDQIKRFELTPLTES